MLSTVLLFCLLTVPSVVSFVPQLLRLARTGDTAGLSATALLTGCVNYTAWSVYLWPTGQAGLLVTNVLASLVWYALAALALRRLPLDGALGGPGCWALVVALAAGLRPDLLGLLLGLGTVLAHAPQAARAWTSPSLAGVSPATWLLVGTQGVGWLVVSAPAGLVGGVVYGATALLTAASVLIAVAVRRSARQPLPAVTLAA